MRERDWKNAGLTLLVMAMGIASARGMPPPRSAVTRHAGEFNGVTVAYSAYVEDNVVDDASGRPGASIISVSYVRDDVADPERRPVIFAFNGGPGAAGSMLNFDALGPVRLAGPARGEPQSLRQIDGGAEGHFVNNPDSLLDAADLVFIDPVGTGFSRAFAGKNPQQWYSEVTDASSVAAAIAHWLAVHHREHSPRYLLGESYGTDRAGMILAQDKLRFNGVILIALAVRAEAGPVPYVTSLPTMAAGAWYHRRIDRDGRTVEQVFETATHFAHTDYLAALERGSNLPPAARQQIAQQMSALIGLPASLIARENLRIDKNTYMFNLLRARQLRTGLLDVRMTAPLLPNEQGAVDDPALGVLPERLIGSKNLTAASLGILREPVVGSYLKHDLRFPTQETYDSQNFIANSRWTFDRQFDPVKAVAGTMKSQPGFRAIWVQGLYDLNRPADLVRYFIARDGVPADRLVTLLLPGPHSPYLAPGNLSPLAAALRKFVAPARRAP